MHISKRLPGLQSLTFNQHFVSVLNSFEKLGIRTTFKMTAKKLIDIATQTELIIENLPLLTMSDVAEMLPCGHNQRFIFDFFLFR